MSYYHSNITGTTPCSGGQIQTEAYNYGMQLDGMQQPDGMQQQAMLPDNSGNYYISPFYKDQQFWKGAVIGTALTLIVTNDKVQKVIMKGAMKVYSAVQGGVQEIKEKFEDVQAEMHQES
ncbi:hypothetical protein GMMP15_660113 [Candidatus Magnetomoraceae bacterium gMMP-15]